MERAPNEYKSSLYSKPQAAEFIGVSISTLDRLMAAGKIEFYRVSLRRIAFSREQLENYLSRNARVIRTQENASALAA